MFLFCSKLLIDRILGGDFDALNMNDYPTSMKNLAPLIRKSDRYWQCCLRMATLMIAPFQLRLVKRRNGIKRQVQQTKRPFEQEANPTKQDSHKQDKHVGNY